MKSALRLRHRADFAGVRAGGRKYRHSALALALRANGLSHNRYGFVTGKWLGTAVLRNRTKRRLRAAICQKHACLRQGYDIVVTARPMAAAQPFDELQRILNELFLQAELSRGKPGC